MGVNSGVRSPAAPVRMAARSLQIAPGLVASYGYIVLIAHVAFWQPACITRFRGCAMPRCLWRAGVCDWQRAAFHCDCPGGWTAVWPRVRRGHYARCGCENKPGALCGEAHLPHAAPILAAYPHPLPFQIAAEAVECTAVERIIVGDGSASIFDMFGGEDRLVDALSLRMGCGVHQFSTSDCRAALFSEVGYAAYRAAAASRQWKADIEACYAVDRFGASLWDLVRRLRRACRSSSAANVVLLTVHAAKGGEWSHVYVHTDLQKSLRAEGDAAEYELNLLYVAITRARKMLYLPPPLVVSWIERAGIII